MTITPNTLKNIIITALLIIIAFLIWHEFTEKPTETIQNTQAGITIENLTNQLLVKDSLLQVNSKRDTVIQIKWKTKIDSIEVYTMPQFASTYDSITSSQVLCLDTLLCFDTIQLKVITKKLYEGQLCKERFKICQQDKVILNDKLFITDSIVKTVTHEKDVWKNGFKNSQEAYAGEMKRKKVWRATAFISIFVNVLQGVF